MKWRTLSQKEQRKRGCHYCADSKNGIYCPFKACPYYELDGPDRFQELKAVAAVRKTKP